MADGYDGCVVVYVVDVYGSCTCDVVVSCMIVYGFGDCEGLNSGERNGRKSISTRGDGMREQE